MVMKNNDFSQYISKPSNDIDIMNSAVIKAYCFTNSIEAVGVSYKSHMKTIREMEQEKQYIVNSYPDVDKEIKKGMTARKRLAQLDEEIIKRRKSLKTRKKATRSSKNRSDNLLSLKRSQKKLVHLLKANFSSPVFALCATLTYREKEHSAKNVYKDFSQFAKKLKYRFPNMVYIAIYEPHKDGSWHIHFVFSGAKGLTVELLERLWNNGFVYIEPFNAFAAPYFCSKNDRLAYYPSGCRLYSTSKNIKEPIEKQFSPEIFKMLIEKTGMHCTGAQARTLYKIEANEIKRVNHFIYMNFQK